MEPGKKYSRWDRKIVECLGVGKHYTFVRSDELGEFLVHNSNLPYYTEVKPVKKGWVNIYPDRDRSRYSLNETRADADRVAMDPIRIACIEIEYYEGQGL